MTAGPYTLVTSRVKPNIVCTKIVQCRKSVIVFGSKSSRTNQNNSGEVTLGASNSTSVADRANQKPEVQTNEVGYPDRLRFSLEEGWQD